MHEESRRRRRIAGASTQFGTEVSINLGSALAGVVVPVVGAPVVVAARQLVMLAAVLPVFRPARERLTWSRIAPAIGLGVVLAVMNLSFYEAVHQLGLGVAATIEFLGPLALALATSRRMLDVVCAVAAGGGVFLLTGLDGSVNAWGVVLALTAAATWAGYILLTRRVAIGLPGLEGVTIAGIVSLVLLVPVAVVTFDASAFDWAVIGMLVAVGILSSAVPYSLDTFILRRIDTRLYAIITSFGPVIAAIFGWIVLSERLTPIEWAAVVVVCAAAGTAIATQREVPVVESAVAEAAAADAIVHAAAESADAVGATPRSEGRRSTGIGPGSTATADADGGVDAGAGAGAGSETGAGAGAGAGAAAGAGSETGAGDGAAGEADQSSGAKR